MLSNWEQVARVVWKILTEAARKKTTVTYEEVAPAIQTNPLSVRNALEPIQKHCQEEGLPPLTALVIGKTTQRPGKGFIAWDPSDIQGAYERVYAFDWDSVVNPYADFDEKDSVDQFAEGLLANPSNSSEIFARVKVRGVRQRIFRSALLKAYSGHCAFCSLSVSVALEAAHIVPYCDPDDARIFDPRNGILLCSTHHHLFDAGLMKVDDSYKLVCTKEMIGDDANLHSTFSQTIALNGHLLRLPDQKHLWPDVKALAVHRYATAG